MRRAVWRGAFLSPEPCAERARLSLVSRTEGSWQWAKEGLRGLCGASVPIHWNGPERQSWVISQQTYSLLPTAHLLKCCFLCPECCFFLYLPIESPRVLQVSHTSSSETFFSEYFPITHVFQIPFIIFLQRLYFSLVAVFIIVITY